MMRTLIAAVALCGLVVTGVVFPAADAQAATFPVDVPAMGTPGALDGRVYAIADAGNTMVAGGTFSKVANPGSDTAIARPYVMAWTKATGAVNTAFAPVLNGEVTALLPGPTPDTVYVAGRFNTVNGQARGRVVLLDTTTGAVDPAFRAPAMNGAILTMVKRGSELIVGGSFTLAGPETRNRLASLDSTSGALTQTVQTSVTDSRSQTTNPGEIAVTKMDITPSGDRLVIIGNFLNVDGIKRDQVAQLDLGAVGSSLRTTWYTARYEAKCSNSFPAYVRDIALSPDGAFFVIGTTGAKVTGTLCDTVARFETNADTAAAQPTWIASTGGDTILSVAISDNAVYAGGHQRWLNNPLGGDTAKTGAVGRPGIAALDPANGVPLAWNPGRNPRGYGATELLLTTDGLWIGSDTEFFGNFQHRRPRIGFFPHGSVAPSDKVLPSLPATLYRAGAPTSATTLHRYNGGGATVATTDGSMSWVSDTPVAWGTKKSYSSGVSYDSTIPAGTPASLFSTDRNGSAVRLAIPVPAGVQVELRLYFSNHSDLWGFVPSRVFGIKVDGATVLDNFDQTQAAGGADIATMRSFPVTSDGLIDVTFARINGYPSLNAAEIVAPLAGGVVQLPVDNLAATAFDGSQAGQLALVSDQGVQWSQVRGAFTVDSKVWIASADGTFTTRPMVGGTLGAPAPVDPYHINAFEGVATESGSTTYSGVTTDLYAQFSQLSGLTYGQDRLFYHQKGSSKLLSRFFSPDSGITATEVMDASNGLDWTRAGSLAFAGSTLYYSDAFDGKLWAIGVEGGLPIGTPVLIDDATAGGNDWRGSTIFLGAANGAPTAVGAVTCSLLECSVSGSQASDSDGSISGFLWEFGDGTSATTMDAVHSYPTDGTYTVKLTVTDNQGGTSAWTQEVTVSAVAPNILPVAQGSLSCTHLECLASGDSSGDADGSITNYFWEFGDGTTAATANATHTYAAAGTYAVTLTVTDDRGGSATWTQAATVEAAPAPVTSSIAFREASSATSNAKTTSIAVPASAKAGDVAILVGSFGLGTAAPSAPAGWTLVRTDVATSLTTAVWTKSLTAADVASAVMVTGGPTAMKSTLTMAVYSGVDSSNPVATAATTDSNTAVHTTPTVSVPQGGWLVEVWSDKSSTTTEWIAPADTVTRLTAFAPASGHTSTLVADSGVPLTAGTWGGHAAQTNAPSGKGINIALVLSPAL